MRKTFLFVFLLSLFVVSHAQDAETKLKTLNIELPAIGKPIANYVHVVRTGNLLFLAGKGPSKQMGHTLQEKWGKI